MMDQLGIKALRPGPSGNEKAPNHANIRRIAGQSLSKSSRPAHDERRPEGDDGEDVVGAAPAGDRRDVFEVRLWARSQQRAEGHMDRDRGGSRDDRLYAGDSQGSDRHGGQLLRSRHQRSHSHDAGHARSRQRARAGADDVWPRRIPGSARALGRRNGPHQRRVEGAAGAAGSIAQGCDRAISGLAAGQGHALPVPADERRRRPAQHLAVDWRGLGLCPDRSGQRAGG
jgi:hypothetical protein